jgi:AraC-like DNA-binding protein
MRRFDRIGDLIKRHSGDGITETVIPGLSIMRSTTATEPLGHTAKPSLAFVFGGLKEAFLGETRFLYGVGQYVVVGVPLPVTAHISAASEDAPFLGLGIDLHPEAIASLLLEAGPPQPAPERPPLGIAVSDVDEPLVDALTRLLGLLDERADLRGLAPAYGREVLWRVLTGPQGDLVRQAGLADSRLTLVSHAISFIRDHYASSITIEDLAEISAMSPATLHRHFRAVTNMTPIQFQKQLRLQAARQRLLVAPGDVAGAGFAVGYQSASQFSREYRKMFGSPPGRDAQALRATAGQALPVI